MKYKVGDFVILNNSKTVCICSIDEEKKKYLVIDAESREMNPKHWYVKEPEIAKKLM